MDVLEDLLSMGGGVYARDIVGNNVLHSAASSGCVPAAELLIQAGAPVNRVTLLSVHQYFCDSAHASLARWCCH